VDGFEDNFVDVFADVGSGESQIDHKEKYPGKYLHLFASDPLYSRDAITCIIESALDSPARRKDTSSCGS